MADQGGGSLYIDGQVFQSAAWHRGMGRYSLNLLGALSRLGMFTRYANVKLILRSGAGEERDVEPALNLACPEAEIVRWELSDSLDRAESNKRLLERRIAQHADGDVDFLILSLFLESAPVFPRASRKMLVVYDLIPLLYPRLYGKAPRFFPDHYLPRFKTLFEADLLFPISTTVANDLTSHLGLPAAKMVPIGGGGTLSDGPLERPDVDGLVSPFVLMPSGDELRKNNLRGVMGFQRAAERMGLPHRLVLTSHYTDDSKAELQQASPRLSFTGNVKDTELRWLFRNSDLVFFPTEYEGLGLPVLEAMRYGKPVAGADIPAFREISASAIYLFDPYDLDSISGAIERAIGLIGFGEMSSQYRHVLKEFNWEEAARRFIDGIAARPVVIADRKRRLAVLGPHPSDDSPIGQILARSHAELERYFEIDYFLERRATLPGAKPDFLSCVADSYDIQSFNALRYSAYDAVIYHIADGPGHVRTIERALHLPGFVVLYDSALGRAFGELEDNPAFGKPRVVAEERLSMEGSAFLTSLVNAQLGVLCHSGRVLSSARSALVEEVPIVQIEIPVPVPWPMHEHPRSDRPVVGVHTGEAWPRAELLGGLSRMGKVELFGWSSGPSGEDDVPAHVRVTVDPTDHELESIYGRIDILVHHDPITNVRAAMTALGAMRHGVVVVAPRDSWFGDLPSEVAVKADGHESILRRVEVLVSDGRMLSGIGRSARDHVIRGHDPARYAGRVNAFISDVASQPPTRNGLIARTIRTERSVKAVSTKVQRLLEDHSSRPSG